LYLSRKFSDIFIASSNFSLVLPMPDSFVKHLFEAEGHHRVTANTDPRNGPSNALLRKLGFRQEAHLRESIKTHIGWCDEYWWGLLAREWQAR